MEAYINHLLEEISTSIENVPRPVRPPGGVSIEVVFAEEEEDRRVPLRPLEELTGISKDQLPPAERLSDDQIATLLPALRELLDTYNWCFVLQTKVPERVQYATIRENFDQPAKYLRWETGFFEFCSPGTEHGRCVMGEYCQCAFYTSIFARDEDEEDLSAEEQRKRDLELEIYLIRKRYGDDWIRYYPYHLDPDYDDEDGNPYNYGFDVDDDDDDDDDWWRK